MKELSKIMEDMGVQNPNGPIMPSKNSLPSRELKPAMSPQETEQIAHIVRQNYDILQTYGKDPEALKNMMRAFNDDLTGHKIESIREAFIKWRRKKNTMPTPADILTILRGDDEPRVASGPAYSTAWMNEPRVNDWHKLTPEQKQAHDEWFKDLLRKV